MGKQLAQEVERQSKIVDDPIVAEYVNRLGQNLVRNSDAKVPFTIKVIQSAEVNAFALPGGFFFVNSGLILKADNEAELAGVMAHEIGHVAARHGTRNATKGQLMQYGTIPLIFMGGWAGYAIYQGAHLAIPMTFLSFSRAMEKEADLLGPRIHVQGRLRSSSRSSISSRRSRRWRRKSRGPCPRFFRLILRRMTGSKQRRRTFSIISRPSRNT